MSAEANLVRLGLTLPTLSPPVGNYIHAVRTGKLLFLSGKVSRSAKGKVGAQLTKEQGNQNAREVGLLLLATLKQELGSLDKISRIVKVLGFVNATPEFEDHPFVINGCSDLLVEVFGDAGRHARSAVGANSLPSNIPVEIELIVELME